MKKQTSAQVSTAASRLLSIGKRGGPLVVHRGALVAAMGQAITNPKHSPEAIADDERRLIALQPILQPYFDAAEACAASALGQDETKGQAGGR